MIYSNRIMEYVAAEPFRPFRINMASGQSFEIRHPEMILVGKSLVRVYQAAGEVPGQPPQWHDASLLLMESLEPMESPATGRR